METVKVPLNEELRACAPLGPRVTLRLMTAEGFIDKHASGTLRKNKALGMAWRAQYLEERTAYEFGWGFELSQVRTSGIAVVAFAVGATLVTLIAAYAIGG